MTNLELFDIHVSPLFFQHVHFSLHSLASAPILLQPYCVLYLHFLSSQVKLFSERILASSATSSQLSSDLVSGTVSIKHCWPDTCPVYLPPHLNWHVFYQIAPL
jgi:hypothetical protein